MKKIKLLLFSALAVSNVILADPAPYIPSQPRGTPVYRYLGTSYGPAVPIVYSRPVIRAPIAPTPRIDYTAISRLPEIEKQLTEMINSRKNGRVLNEAQINQLIQQTNSALQAIRASRNEYLWSQNSEVIEKIWSLMNYIGNGLGDRLLFPSTFVNIRMQNMQNIQITLKKARSFASQISYLIDKTDMRYRGIIIEELENCVKTLKSYLSLNLDAMLKEEIYGVIKYAQNILKTTSPYAPETADSFWGSFY